MIRTNKYFEVKLKGEVCGRVFNKECNQLSFDNPRFLECRHVDNEGNRIVLAMFPYDRIEAIFNEED